MAITNLSQYYSSKGKPLPTTAAERFADPAFKTAAEKAGYNSDTYQVNMGNADANNKILGNLLGDNQLITTSTDSRNTAMNATSALDHALSAFNLTGNTPPANANDDPNNVNVGTYQDSYTKMLDDMGARSDSATRALISQIQAQKQNSANQTNTRYENYKRGLQLLGIQHNDAQFTPDLLSGHLLTADNEQHDKIRALDAEETKAIMDANNARADNNFKLVKEKMDYVAGIKKEKQNALKDLYDKMNTQKGIADLQAHQVYDTMQNLNEADKEAFIVKVSQKYGIDPGVLTQALSDEKQARIDKAAKDKKAGSSASSTYKITASQKGKLLGLGLSQSQIAGFGSDLGSSSLEEAITNLGLSGDKANKIRDLFGADNVDSTTAGGSGGSTLTMDAGKATALENLGIQTDDVVYIQDALAQGHTIDEIAKLNGYSPEVTDLLKSYVK